MKPYKPLFKESHKKAPYKLEAQYYSITDYPYHWKSINEANKLNKSIISRLTPTMLHKEQEYIQITDIQKDGKHVRVIWKNNNNIYLSSTLSFDNEKELENSGWIR